ncbi:MAG: alcohol dehydrogenase catalytic domain-containing protein [Candidatus Aminicenantia bacterium]
MKMKAVVKAKPGPGAELVEVDVPKISSKEVLIKVKATSICGTDVHIYQWDEWSNNRIGAKNLPQIIGHEVAGEVVEVGSEVTRIKVGDYVSAETHIYDPWDLQSLLGQAHLGEKMKILGVDCNGTFADYLALPESVCWINHPSIPPEIATLQEPLGNATYAVLGEDNDVAGKSMVIVGDGPIGLFSVGVAKLCGVTNIFLIGEWGYNLSVGKEMGADHTLFANRDEIDRIQYVKDHTGEYGADIVLDMAGAPQAIEEGLKMLRRGGRFTAFGITSSTTIDIDYNEGIVLKGIQIYGITGRKLFDTWYRVHNFLASGRLNIYPVISHMYHLTEFKKGFEAITARPRKSAKIVLFPNEQELKKASERLKKQKP